jgi:hypothetical protein
VKRASLVKLDSKDNEASLGLLVCKDHQDQLDQLDPLVCQGRRVQEERVETEVMLVHLDLRDQEAKQDKLESLEPLEKLVLQVHKDKLVVLVPRV